MKRQKRALNVPLEKAQQQTTHASHVNKGTRPTNRDPLVVLFVRQVKKEMAMEDVLIVTWVTPDEAKKTRASNAAIVMLVRQQQFKVRQHAKNAMSVPMVVRKAHVTHVQRASIKTPKAKANVLNVQKENSTSILKHRAVGAI
jgi:hypothetical protein